MSVVGRAQWELDLVSGWNAQDDDECLTITKSTDGAFQLSSATKKDGKISVGELFDQYAGTIPESANLENASFGGFAGIGTEFLNNGYHWTKFWIADADLLILATYNGLPDAWDKEKTDVVTMLRSIRRRSQV